VMGGPWTYEGGHDFAMHGPDKEFYDELVSTVASGVVGRGMSVHTENDLWSEVFDSNT